MEPRLWQWNFVSLFCFMVLNTSLVAWLRLPGGLVAKEAVFTEQLFTPLNTPEANSPCGVGHIQFPFTYSYFKYTVCECVCSRVVIIYTGNAKSTDFI